MRTNVHTFQNYLALVWLYVSFFLYFKRLGKKWIKVEIFIQKVIYLENMMKVVHGDQMELNRKKIIFSQNIFLFFSSYIFFLSKSWTTNYACLRYIFWPNPQLLSKFNQGNRRRLPCTYRTLPIYASLAPRTPKPHLRTIAKSACEVCEVRFSQLSHYFSLVILYTAQISFFFYEKHYRKTPTSYLEKILSFNFSQFIFLLLSHYFFKTKNYKLLY